MLVGEMNRAPLWPFQGIISLFP